MRVSLVWSSPMPERTIAVAMRRCYSTKPVEDIEAELEKKGREYWKFLLTKALQDKSLDVFEHFTMTFLIEDAGASEVTDIAVGYPHIRLTKIKEDNWLLSMNARTLVEMWKSRGRAGFSREAVDELRRKDISPLLAELAFAGGGPNES